jgi:predicted ribosomally synthesized peptide with nif11-like leader
MGLESAQAFWTRVRDDGEFRRMLAAATTDQELGKLIVDAGFTVTAEELKTSLQEWKTKSAAAGQELSEQDLEKVAGGSMPGRYLPGFNLFDLKLGMTFVAPIGFKG